MTELPMPDLKYGITMRLHADESSFCIPSKDDVDTLPFIVEAQHSAAPLQFSVTDKLAWHHQNLLGKSVQITIPENFHGTIKLKNPLKKQHSFDAIKIHAGKEAKVTVMEECDPCKVRFTRVQIKAEDNASVQFVTAHNGGILWSKREGVTAKNARIAWFESIQNAELAYARTKTTLQEQGSCADAVSTFAGDAGKYDILIEHDHQAPETKSNILSKGVLDGSATGIAQGKIIIGKDASKSSAFQREHVLLLGHAAVANAIPQLFIHNHDVECSHSASVSNVDDHALFYLMTRGIPKQSAMLRLKESFLADALIKMPGADHAQ